MDAEPWKRVQALYETALQLDTEKRDEFLRRFCGDEPRTRELVESMLRERDQAGPDALTLRQDAFIGTTVGSYEIREKLGQGGMGLVYKALQTRLNRWVALKVLPFEKSGDPKKRRRFLQEARTASALNHPHIVTIHDIVTIDDIDYIIMEYVQGTTLTGHIPAGGLPIGEALRYAQQLAEALSAAHAKGVIHRDLKPANVMVPQSGVVKILDFGLAKLQVAGLGLSASEAAPLTEEGAIVGTLDYMSPEQAQGLPVDARTDIFSLGVVLYEMLTGLRPFRGRSQPSVLHEICYTTPTPLEHLRRELPRELAAIVERCLAKPPEARYPSANELGARLRGLAGKLELAEGTSRERTATRIRLAADKTPPEPAPASSRRRLGGALLAVSAAGLAGYLAFDHWEGRDSTASPASPKVPLAVDSPDVTPYALYNDGRTHLARADQEGRVDRAIDAFESAIERDDAYAPAYAGLAAAYREKYAWSSRDALWLEQATGAAERAVELDALLATAHAELGLALAEKGESDDARAALEQALRLDPQCADAQLGLAIISRSSRRMSDADERYRRAIALRPDNWKLYSAYGEFLFEQAKYDEAEKAYGRVLELTPDNFVGWQSLAAMLHMQGRSAEAAAALQRALEIQPDANTYSNLGTLLYFEGRYPAAAAAFERAVELRPNQYVFWANLGDAYRWVPGGTAKSRNAFARAIQLAREEANAGGRAARERLPEYLAKAGETDAALRALAELETEAHKSPDTWFVLVKAYELCGERDKALEALAEALSGGYSMEEVKREPELLKLRQDVRYHRLVLPWDKERDVTGESPRKQSGRSPPKTDVPSPSD